MKHSSIPYALALLLAIPAWSLDPLPPDAAPAPKAVFTFDQDALAKPPHRFAQATMGAGPAAKWEVRQDHTAPSKPNVLVQSGNAPGENYAPLLLSEMLLDHGEAGIRFKAMSAEGDQTMGIVFRFRDPKNYYVILASSRDDTCGYYRIKNGKRKELATNHAIIAPFVWHDLRITFTDKTFTALVDGEAVLGGKDSSFISSGQIGIVAHANSNILFDNFEVAQ